MKIAGVDLSTWAIDVVTLDFASDDSVRWWRAEISSKADREPTDVRAFLAARRVYGRIAHASVWRGVEWVFVEKPMSKSRRSIATQMRVQGAIVASIPPSISAVWETPPEEWKLIFTGAGNAPHERVVERARELDFEGPTDDAFSAFGIAWAMREKLRARTTARQAA